MKQNKKDQNYAELLSRKAPGISVKAFCKENGIHTNTYYYWRKRLNSPSILSNRHSFIPLTITTPNFTDPFEVVLHNGLKIRVPCNSDTCYLQQLISSIGTLS